MRDLPVGLGTRLRALIAALDGGVQEVYDKRRAPVRPRYYPVLRHLLAAESASVGALAAEAGVAQPSLTQTLQAMAGEGIVHLQAGADRRQRLVTLTSKGADIAGALMPVWAATHRAAAALDAELPCPLGATVDAALARLRLRPFGDRIEAELAG
jgi:DNA-binding MarR family transcriptional regulator